MKIVVGTMEAFEAFGSGIRSFANSLIQSVYENTDNELSLLLEPREMGPRSKDIYSTNLYQVHRRTSLSLFDKIYDRFEGKASSLKALVNPWRLRRAVPLHTTESVHREAGKRALQINHASYDSSTPEAFNRLNFLASRQAFSAYKLAFGSSRKIARIALPCGPKAASSASSRHLTTIYHSPLPFPLFPDSTLNVTTIHDLIPLAHPDLCLDNPSEFYDLLCCTIANSHVIHAISDYTAQTLTQYFGASILEKVRVLHQPISALHSSLSDASAILSHRAALYRRLASGEECPIVQMGTIEPKKNHATSIEAFKLLRRRYPNLRFVVLGRPGWLCEGICTQLSNSKDEGIEWHGYANSRIRDHILKQALFLLFPSVVEGWGLPPLEAMMHGTPVIASSIPATKEACGSAALFLKDHLDPVDIFQASVQLIENPDLAVLLTKRGLEHVRNFAPEGFSRALNEMYAQI